MNSHEENNIDNFIVDAQKKLEEFVLEKEELNSKIKNYLISFQSYDSEIYKTFFNARQFYSERRHLYNLKLTKLKNRKIEYERIWKNQMKKLEVIPKPKLDENSLVLLDYTRKSLENIENEIEIINQNLEEQILDIEEENEIIEQLRELEKEKKEKMNILTNIEQKQIKNLQNSNYYTTQTKIKDLEKDLSDIYTEMFELLNKRLLTHKKTLDLYKRATEFEKIKETIKYALKENKTTAERFEQLFHKLMILDKKVLLDEISSNLKPVVRPKKKKTADVEAIIKKKKKFKRFEQRKLESALKKQKLGKKLDFYEYKLILKHSKK
ncbi:MAG: hypothetical protein ACFFDB_08930 [Promethearchaeota archaeon]